MTPPQKILIVDDKQENLFALRNVLKELDVEIIEADNGNDALAATLDHRFSVAILDVMMPGIDGYELAEYLKGDAATRHLPIIFVTAVYSEEERIFKGYESGAVDYIVKPYNPTVLLAKVNVFLELDRVRNELSDKITELTASEERFRTLVATIPDIVYRIDGDGRFTYLNDAVMDLGYELEDLIGSHFSMIIHPDDIDNVSRTSVLPNYRGLAARQDESPKLFDERRTGQRITKGLEVRLVPKKGGQGVPAVIHSSDEDVIVGEINSSGLYMKDQNNGKKNLFLGSVGVIRDINERKQVEKELHEYRKNLEKLVRERTAKLHEEIAERKQAEKILAERERYFRGMMHSLYEDLLVVDSQYNITDINDTYLRTLGKRRDEVIGLHCSEVLHRYGLPCDGGSTDCFLRPVFETGLPQASFHDYQSNNGTRAYVEITLSPLKDSAGDVTNVVAAIHDVTEIVTARKEAENAHRKLSMALRSGKVFFWEWDIESDKIAFSSEWKTHLGYEAAEEVEYQFDFEKRLHPEDRALIAKLLMDIKSGVSEEHVAEFRFRHKDGSYCWFYCRAQGIRDKSEKVNGIIGCNIDITEKKIEEERRENLQKQLIESQKMESIGRLAGGIAHDFNNLLTIIISYATMALEIMPDDSALKGDIQEICNAGERAAALTRQLLAFSRKQVIHPALLQLNKVVSNVEKMLLRVLGEDICFKKQLEPDLGLVLADPGQIEQVLLNMAVNARDAMPEGGKLIIETANVELDEEYVSHHINVKAGSYVMLAVSDSGFGMDALTCASIFEPFFTTKPKGRGTGLGLSTVYGIVKQSGGDIWVYSEVGKGTTFKIYLPCGYGEVQDAVQKAASRKAVTGSETILVVEDDSSVRNLTKTILRRCKYNILSAADGQEALKIAREFQGRIDLVLTDVIMPEMNGRVMVEFMSEIRPGIKVLYMSGYTDNAIVHHGVLDSEANFIGKPFTLDTLLKRVREVLDQG